MYIIKSRIKKIKICCGIIECARSVVGSSNRTRNTSQPTSFQIVIHPSVKEEIVLQNGLSVLPKVAEFKMVEEKHQA